MLDEESFFWGCPLPFKINHLSLHEIILPYTDWYFQLLFGLLVKLQNLVGRTITLLMLLLKPWSIANMCPVLIFFCQFYFGRWRWNGWTGSTSLFLRQIYSFFFFFKIEIHSVQSWTTTMRHKVTRKRNIIGCIIFLFHS